MQSQFLWSQKNMVYDVCVWILKSLVKPRLTNPTYRYSIDSVIALDWHAKQAYNACVHTRSCATSASIHNH